MAEDFLIVGIAGKIRSGKDTLAEIFIQNGYFGVSVGDIVRERSRELHSDDTNPISTENMTKTSNYLRAKLGSDFLFKEAIARYKYSIKFKSYNGLVIYSIRAPIEADRIVENHGQLIWIEANDEIRYKRAMENLRTGDSVNSFEKFKLAESKQFTPDPNMPDESQMNLGYVKNKATKLLTNNDSSMNKFKAEALELVKSIKLN
jgi:dephospho-CoA kinase